MKCPSCMNQLTVQTVSGITLDVCDNGCGGIWFDKLELKKFDEKKELNAEALLKINILSKSTVNTQKIHDCPKCSNVKLMRHFSSTKMKIAVDECPQCAGFWLDAGELSAIRDEFDSEEDRKRAAENVFSEMFSSKLAEEKNKSSERYEKYQNLAKALRYITPSYYAKKTGMLY